MEYPHETHHKLFHNIRFSCRALCKISKRFDIWTHEVSRDLILRRVTDIIYNNRPLVRSCELSHHFEGQLIWIATEATQYPVNTLFRIFQTSHAMRSVIMSIDTFQFRTRPLMFISIHTKIHGNLLYPTHSPNISHTQTVPTSETCGSYVQTLTWDWRNHFCCAFACFWYPSMGAREDLPLYILQSSNYSLCTAYTMQQNWFESNLKIKKYNNVYKKKAYEPCSWKRFGTIPVPNCILS